MNHKPLVTGIIGAGAISDAYLKSLQKDFREEIELKYISAAHLESAQKKAAEYGLTALSTGELLKKEEVELVIILTPVETHAGLIEEALKAGKHVYSEKTLTLHAEEGRKLLALTKEKNLYLGCAPDTFLGAMVQSAKKALEEGMIGDVHSFGILINRNNDLLTSMFPFLRKEGAGILRDYVVYYLTALTVLLGEVDSVSALLSTPYPVRTGMIPGRPEYQKEFETPNEAVAAVILRMKNGVIGVLHDDSESALVDHSVFNLYGRNGILKLGNPNNFGDPVSYVKGIQDFRNPEAPIVLESANRFIKNNRGIGAAEMVHAIWENREAQASAQRAIHVLDIIEAIEKSAETGKFEKV